MIDELIIYGSFNSIFQQICTQLPDIEDRYHVSPSGGDDLNSNNLDKYINDSVLGLVDKKVKYPICMCFPPTSKIIDLNGSAWEEFNFRVSFLQRTYIDGKNQIRERNTDTNTSSRLIEKDWNDMKNDAARFVQLFKAVLKTNVTIPVNQTIPFKTVLNTSLSPVPVRRLSNVNNDRLSGVEILFSVVLNIAYCEEVILDNDQIIVQLFKDYYSKEEIDAKLEKVIWQEDYN